MVLEIRLECNLDLCLPLEGLDLAKKYHPPLAHHRQGIEQRMKLLRIKLGGGSLIVIEVAEGWIECAVKNRVDRLVLEHVFRAGEIINGGDLAPLHGAQDALPGLCGHGAEFTAGG